jgi:C-terminal peptidase prc
MRGRKHKDISLLAGGLIVICLLVTVGCRKKTEPASPAATPTAAVDETNRAASSPDDERAVRQLANEFIAAICSDSSTPLTRLEEIFADDICQITMEGNIIRGKQNNLFFYRSRQEKNRTNLRSRTARYDIQSVKISCDLAVVFGEVEGERWRKNAPEPSRFNFWETLVFRKIGGEWRLVQEQTTRPRPARERKESSFKDERPAVEETGQTREHSSSPFIGFGVGVEGASDDTNRHSVSETIKLSPEQTRNLEENIKGSFHGIGVEIDTNPNGIYIKNVIPESPADDAGLSDGEVIAAINGESTVGMSLERAVSLIRGPEGTNVDLKILSNNGTHRDVGVVRGTVVVTGVESCIVEPNIGLLAISRFNEETPAKVRDALMYFQQQKIKGLVLDLRSNQGGFLTAAKEITSMFTGPDQIIWYVQYTNRANRTPEKGTVQKMVQWPVVVLVISETRSGGELLASAVRSVAGGRLLGQKTFGKGSARTIEKQPDGTSRKILTGYLYTADGQAIDGRGINPDRELDPKLSSEEALKQAVYELTKETGNRK